VDAAVRRTRRLGLLLLAAALVASAQVVAIPAAGARAGGAEGDPAARRVEDLHDRSAVVPSAALARARRAHGTPTQVSLALAMTVGALAAGWLLRASRRRDHVSRPFVAFERRGPPLLPVVA
jgi:hypothetical protein